MPFSPNTTRTGFATLAPSAGSMMYAVAPAGAGLRANAAGAAGAGAAAGGAGAGAAGAAGSCWPQAARSPQARRKAPYFSMNELPRILFSATLAQGTLSSGRRRAGAILRTTSRFARCSGPLLPPRRATVESAVDRLGEHDLVVELEDGTRLSRAASSLEISVT